MGDTTMPANSSGDLADKRRALLRQRMASQGIRPAAAPATPRIGRRAAGLDAVPQSFAQQRLWFLDRLAPGNPFYTVSLAIPVNAAIDAAALQAALDQLVLRHESLRTTFAEEGGQPVQRIARPGPARLDRADLSHLPAQEREAQADRLADAEMRRSFDLEAGPLMVATLVTQAPARHTLLLTLHHIICDGWSLRVLSRELMALYESALTGRPCDLAELPIQYPDFALWQREQMQGSVLADQLAYWRRTLEGVPPLTLWPDRTRPAIPSYRGGLVPLSLDAQAGRQLARRCAESNATPFVVLMAAFMVLLSRHSGQQDIVVGTPIANRTRPELEPLIGFFVNSLVVRGDLSGDPSFVQLVERVRDRVLDAFAHQDLPFERLVEELAPQRVLGRNPLFQVIFQLFAAQDGAVSDGASDVRQRGTAKFDLRLDLWPTQDGGYAGELEFGEDVFGIDTARVLARHYLTLTKRLLDAPDRPVHEVDMMDDQERDFVLRQLNATDTPFDQDIDIATLFGRMARAQPDTPALCCPDGRLSYAELDLASGRVADQLAARHVRAGDTVGVLIPRSACMVIAWLAVLKLGASYVPLDPDQPAKRLGNMLADADCRLTMCDAARVALAASLPVPFMVPDPDADDAGPHAKGPPVTGSSVANIIFTSGSTGRPKGVQIPHRGVTRLVQGRSCLSMTPGTRMGLASNPAFDASTFEVWGGLLNGCTLVAIDRDTLLSGPALAACIAREKLDHLFLTTALFNRLAVETPGLFAPLTTLMTGGARAEAAVFSNVIGNRPPRRLLHMYGPTETTVFASAWEVSDWSPHTAAVPIGRPVPNTTCYVLDARHRPVALGVAGELHVGGAGVALGYAGPETTASARFVPDPWQPGGRLYATGDKVRWRADGQLVFLGRMDNQVKVRGFRVEPDEIAAVLASHPAVRHAVVTARPRPGQGDDDDLALIAYVQPHEDAPSCQDAPAAQGASDLVDHWRTLYDTVLYDSPAESATFNTSGWTDTATGAPIPEVDMHEQVMQTVARAMAHKPRRVLEIGCGTGLLLFRMAGYCQRYVGTDISTAALNHVRETLGGQPALAHVELIECAADDLSRIPPGEFDLVLLNSVIQYFPSFDYLVQVVRAATQRLAPGGRIHLGDVRHQGLLPAFQTHVLLGHAPDDASLGMLRQAVERRLDEEQELALAPAAIVHLADAVPGLAVQCIELKRGRHHNELNRFRFDAMLALQARQTNAIAPLVLRWHEDLGASLTRLQGAAETTHAPALRVTGIPNSRIATLCAATRMVQTLACKDAGSLRARAAAMDEHTAIDPEALWALGETCGRTVHVTWHADDPALLDVLLLDPAQAPHVHLEWGAMPPLGELVTQPLRGHFARKLVPALKAYAMEQLPSYMRPEHHVRVRSWPLSANGKIDVAALPEPDRLRADARPPDGAPVTETQHRLFDLLAEVLGTRPVSVREHFFNDLGGHSLLATQVMSRLRRAFSIELPLRAIFEAPTIAALSAMVDAALNGPAPDAIEGDALAGLDVDALDDSALDALLAELGGKT